MFAAIIGFSVLVATDEGGAQPWATLTSPGCWPPARQRPACWRSPMRRAPALRWMRDVQGYYVLPPGYLTGEAPQLVYLTEAPSGEARGAFSQLVREALLADQAPDVRQRLEEGLSVTMQSAEDGRELASDDFLSFLIPLFAGMFYVFAVLSSAGYLLQAMTTEKENRTVEVMATSLSPMQLVTGKAVGLFAVAMTQLAIWGAAAVAALAIAAAATDLFRGVQIPWSLMAVVLIYFVPSFALVAGIMITLGGVVTDLQQGQQIAGIVNLFFIMPFFLFAVILARPDSPLAVGLTLFPTTAFLTVAMRWGVTTVPAWQMAAGLVGLLVCAAIAVWVAARVFRIGMLSYGQRLSWQAVRAALRGRNSRGATYSAESNS
ncbi:MAG: ABC transporter permease [Caldilineales bacterium]